VRITTSSFYVTDFSGTSLFLRDLGMRGRKGRARLFSSVEHLNGAIKVMRIPRYVDNGGIKALFLLVTQYMRDYNSVNRPCTRTPPL
jgi:hypothetical protein